MEVTDRAKDFFGDPYCQACPANCLRGIIWLDYVPAIVLLLCTGLLWKTEAACVLTCRLTH